MTDLIYEMPLWKKGHSVIGVDEVGRGCIAGPIFVAAICFNGIYNTTSYLQKTQKWGIYDSKQILASKREEIHQKTLKSGIPHAFAASSVPEINRVGIVEAYQLAAKRAVSKLIKQYKLIRPYLLSDAFRINNIQEVHETHQSAIVKGDTISRSIALASIIAKVERDKYMIDLAGKYPQYYWEKNKGYGTKDHRNAILNLGPTSHHRTLFIRKIIN